MTLVLHPVSIAQQSIEAWINNFHEITTCAVIPDGTSQENAISGALKAVGYPDTDSMIGFYNFLHELKRQQKVLLSLTVETLKKLQAALEAASRILQSELIKPFPGGLTQWGYMITTFCQRFGLDLFYVIVKRIDYDDKVRMGWIKE